MARPFGIRGLNEITRSEQRMRKLAHRSDVPLRERQPTRAERVRIIEARSFYREANRSIPCETFHAQVLPGVHLECELGCKILELFPCVHGDVAHLTAADESAAIRKSASVQLL